MKIYIPTIAETKANNISEDNGWTNYGMQLIKLDEETQELKDACNDAERIEELADVEFVLNSIRRKFNVTSEQLLHISIEKNTIRKTDPNYKR